MNLKIAVNNDDQKQGNSNAPLVLVEYGDYECPHCSAAYPIIKKLQRHFDDKLLFVFRNFPLSEMHSHALAAARVAEAAAVQGKFWPVHDLIFENQSGLSNRQLLNLAQATGVDLPQLVKDIRTERIQAKVENDIEGGIKSGVNGTPTFFINGKRYDSYYDYDLLKSALDREL